MSVKQRLEYLRGEIKKECISYSEILELESLKEHIEKGDVELLQWAEDQSEENNIDKTKEAIQQEILAILDNQIEVELSAMQTYTVAEIAREVLLDVKQDVVKF